MNGFGFLAVGCLQTIVGFNSLSVLGFLKKNIPIHSSNLHLRVQWLLPFATSKARDRRPSVKAIPQALTRHLAVPENYPHLPLAYLRVCKPA